MIAGNDPYAPTDTDIDALGTTLPRYTTAVLAESFVTGATRNASKTVKRTADLFRAIIERACSDKSYRPVARRAKLRAFEKRVLALVRNIVNPLGRSPDSAWVVAGAAVDFVLMIGDLLLEDAVCPLDVLWHLLTKAEGASLQSSFTRVNWYGLCVRIGITKLTSEAWPAIHRAIVVHPNLRGEISHQAMCLGRSGRITTNEAESIRKLLDFPDRRCRKRDADIDLFPEIGLDVDALSCDFLKDLDLDMDFFALSQQNKISDYFPAKRARSPSQSTSNPCDMQNINKSAIECLIDGVDVTCRESSDSLNVKWPEKPTCGFVIGPVPACISQAVLCGGASYSLSV
jgi:hypothetical protein